ncbi:MULTISPECIES: hypothetical protein [Enterococcus]|uniref:hypothetical protein n=1 Tax=Enterococcus TaxID=1350 RepID=UPI000BF1E2D5|nr:MULTISPECIES: hypothetical protein [Enterococcus]MBO0432282.1 hypothetical protein [Enterococcus sp. DIV0660C]PEH49695.1 hypothetical protein CRM75_00635 [Enterococcus faecium]
MEDQEDIQQYIDREISLRSENKELKKELSYLKEQVKILNNDKNNLLLEIETKYENKELTIQLNEKVKQLQSELIDYKQRSYGLIENQKTWLKSFYNDVDTIERENDKLTKQLLDRETELEIITERYTKMMNTKTMKWTGKYWNLLKKIH